MSTGYILAIDQGTTSTRTIVFDGDGRQVGAAQKVLPQHFPHPGWVEHDPDTIWRDTVACMEGALARARLEPARINGIGITNQRETVVVWDRATGAPLHPAIVWQDRRTAPLCERWRQEGHEALVQARTGLVIDPYFSASKLVWLLENVEGLRTRAERGEVAFGTVDSFLLWRLTAGRVHTTDITNAARAMLYDIHRQCWDDELLALFGIPRSLLPEVLPCDARFGETEAALLGTAVPVTGIAGDQQAATVGQACLQPGMMKSTYGTGSFALMNTGTEAVASAHRLLTTVAYAMEGGTAYALEGSIFIAGAAVQWLRDTLGLIRSAAETDALARKADPRSGVYIVPAFVGLGAPYWDSEARGAILGLTRADGVAEIVAATLESVCFQTRDLMEAVRADGAAAPVALRVDGGMVENDWMLQRLADILGVPVERPLVSETTALGAACLAGLSTGVVAGSAGIARMWRAAARFEPQMSADRREARYAGWRAAVGRVRTGG